MAKSKIGIDRDLKLSRIVLLLGVLLNGRISDYYFIVNGFTIFIVSFLSISTLLRHLIGRVFNLSLFLCWRKVILMGMLL